MNDSPWIIAALIATSAFTVLEGYALNHPERMHTLSYCVAWVGKRWPLSLFLWGLFVGALAVHFFWPFCPFGDSVG
jgi:hypothetical protein